MCPTGRKESVSCHLSGPLEEKVLFTLQKVPPRDWLWFFFLSLSTPASSKFFWLLCLVPDLRTIYLFAERVREKDRETDSALAILAWCVRVCTGFPIVISGKEKADVNHHPLRIHLAVL